VQARFAVGIVLVAAALAAPSARAQAPAPAPVTEPEPGLEPAPGPAPGPAAAPAREMGFAETVAWAIPHGGLVRAARAGTDALEAKLTQAKWTEWPHVSASTALAPMPGRYGGPNEGSTDYAVWGVFSRTEITGWVPLYTFNKIKHLKAAASLGVDVGKAGEGIATAETRFRLHRAFFALSLARELSAIIDEGRGYLDKARRHVEELEAADDPGLDPVDKLKLRVAEAQIKSRDLEARRGLALAEAAIRTVAALPAEPVRLKVGTPEPVKSSIDLVLEDLTGKAVAGRPELVALRTGIAAREAEVRARRTAFWPDLLFAAQFTYTHAGAWYRTGVDSPGGYTGRAGLVLKLDLELGRKIGELHEAQANLAKLSADASEAERGVRLEVERLFREAVDARTMVDAQMDAMNAARGWVISKTDLYDNDLAEMTDVLNGLVQFFQSRMDYLKSIHDWNVALAALERATGARLVPEAF